MYQGNHLVLSEKLLFPSDIRLLSELVPSYSCCIFASVGHIFLLKILLWLKLHQFSRTCSQNISAEWGWFYIYDALRLNTENK